MSLAKSAADYSPCAQAPGARLDIRLDVPFGLAGQRLDQALCQLLPDYSRSRLAQWIRDQHVRLDGASAKPNQRLRGGETITVDARLPADGSHVAQAIGLDVVYEDADLLVVDKPAGLVVHPGSGNLDGTLLNALLHHAPELDTVPRAGIVHRLDKDTSGLLVVAKTIPAQVALARQLLERSVRREYLAVALGQAPASGRVDAPIGRHPVQRTRMAVVSRGRPAITDYERLRGGRDWSLLRCRLHTGRTHQIRVHLQRIGHPLVGDPTYGSRAREQVLPDGARDFARQALHATRLQLEHPRLGTTLAWEAPPPADFDALLRCLEAHAAPAA